MTKFLTYAFLFMVVVGGCSEAFSSTDYTTDTTLPAYVAPETTTTEVFVPVTNTTIATKSRTTAAPKRKSTITSGNDIDCDNAEELYDSGEYADDIADYCDYGPDSEWDTNDDYDSWEE